LSQAGPLLDHLTSCSPCYRDFLGLQAKYRQRRTRMIFAVAASVLIVVGLATWVTLRRDNNAQIARAVVDLRDRSAARGTGPHSNEMPIEIFRNVLNLEVYLPLGSSEGSYEFRVVTDAGQTVSSAAGIAKVKSGITSLRLSVNISSARPGPYTLQLRKVGSDWSSYPLQIR
jgi:hypothetical protein